MRRPPHGGAMARQARCILLGVAMVMPGSALSQTRDVLMGPLVPYASGWAYAWSPLVPIGALAGMPPSAAALFPGLLLAAPPPVGALWAAGAPAFAASEIPGARAELSAARFGSDGTLRRPLDAQESTVTTVSGLAWQPVGLRAHGIGRVLFDRETFSGGGTRGSGFTPFSGSPFVLADSTSPEVSRSRAVLEGVMGWELGRWGIGVGVGYEARDVTAVRALVRRSGRAATSSGSFGVGRSVGGLRASAYARVGGASETLTMVHGLALPFIHEMQGFTEVEPIEPANQGYRRRITRRSQALGATISGRLLDASWVVWGEGTRLRERQSSISANDPPTDRWSTDGAAFGALAERMLFDSAVRVVGHVRALTLEGFAERRDLDGAIFRADEEGLQADAMVRIAPPGSAWEFGAVIATQRESRRQRDLLSSLRASIEAWTPGVSIEIARTLGARTAVSGGYAVREYAPTSHIFGADSLGPVVQQLVAPSLEYATTPKRVQAASLTLRSRVATTTALFAVRHEWLSLSGLPSPTPFRPHGSRSGTQLAITFVIGQYE